ncbi:DUF2103 domain-containing protein [Ferroacidibacillus organovorans]|uniref:Uncharacterized protein n=1 Tax=Ferroacidibacillus organovorans TaxID=1765683 RepID=A0A853K9P5_9BACL|nr:DUF2103 domain-containing protein [Ferroacidibacillus organovorans]KYP80035.1 hypothetical protein AYJ22_12810 [Ferroacidibacillus organovorans]OAG93052.1 hypothetical protein AYW79_12635 [Ferroacidibacillus organovorans]
MADHRRRDGKVKILHTIIGDFGKVLRQIATLDEVESILTGTIAPSKSYQETLTFQYFTDQGLKLLAKTTTAVQEIFIVTPLPDVLLDELIKMGYIAREREDVHHGPSRKRKIVREPRYTEDADEPGQTANKKRGNAPQKTASSVEPETLGQRLGSAQRDALLRLKEQVKPKGEIVAPTSDSRRVKNVLAYKQMKATSPSTASEEEDFASLFSPQDDEDSFEKLFSKSKLDHRFFK